MDKDKLKTLRWFAEFANMKLGVLSEGDRDKLKVDVKEYLFPTRELDQIYLSYFPGPIIEEVREREAKLCAPWSSALPKRDEQGYWEFIESSQGVIKGTLGGLSEMHADKGRGIHVANRRGWSKRIEVTFGVIYPKGGQYDLFYIPSSSHKDYLELKLHRLVNGLPTSTVQKCLQCKSFFIRPSQNRRKFCSARCSWLYHAATRRKKDREGENKKKREAMEKLRDERLLAAGHKLSKKRSKYRDPVRPEAKEGKQKAKGGKLSSGRKKDVNTAG